MMDSFGLASDPFSVLDSLGGEFELPSLFPEAMTPTEGDSDAAIALQGEDLRRFTFRLDQAMERARRKMHTIHEDARRDRNIYMSLRRRQEYEGQPNLTTPMSANKADGLLAQVIDAIEQRPLASFVPEGLGKPAEAAARVAPACAAYLEREINRGGSRERLVREISKEAVQVGTGITKLAMVQHPSGEWFATPTSVIPIETFYVDRIRVSNLKHTFCAYEEVLPYYVLEEMADAGLLDPDAVKKISAAHSDMNRSESEKESGFYPEVNAFDEENAVHEIMYCYMRFRAIGGKSEIYEAVWSRQYKILLAVRPNPVREAFDHPPLAMLRIGKQPGHLFGRGVMRRLDAIQEMSDNAVNSHLAINNLAASPPFMYRANSPFGRLLESQRRLLPGVGIPTLGAPDRGDVAPLQFNNPGLSLQDVSVAQSFADKATFTEEAIGSTSARKTLGQFRVEMQRGTLRIHLDLGDLAYDYSQLLTMMWAMMIAYKVIPNGIVEVEEGGKFLAAKTITTSEITEVMDQLVMTQFQEGVINAQDLQEFEEEFNGRLTDDQVPSARRSDLTIHLTGTKVIADKATELEMLSELTPYILQGIDLARQDSYFNYHLRSLVESMGFKDIEKRIPPDPGEAMTDPTQRQQLGQPLADTIQHSSNMV